MTVPASSLYCRSQSDVFPLVVVRGDQETSNLLCFRETILRVPATKTDRRMARSTGYFKQLLTVDPPRGELQTAGLQRLDADPPINETAPSVDDIKEAVVKLKSGKAVGICNISVKLFKVGGEAMISGLHTVLCAPCLSGIVPPGWKKRGWLVVLIWKGKGDRNNCNSNCGITLFSKQGIAVSLLLLVRLCSHLLKHQTPEQSGFTPGKSTTELIQALCVLVDVCNLYHSQ